MSDWADSQQFHQDARFTVEANGGTVPKVKLLWMTPDPLGAVAALASMYEGKVVRSLEEITEEDRKRAFTNTQKTHLRAPLEAVKLHFLIEGVDRAFTHQLVRQRTAVYAQESLRFAVVGDLKEATTLPPSLADTHPFDPEWLRDVGPTALGEKAQRWRHTWDETLDYINDAYHLLVNSGMPAEEARGLLPHCTATRIQYVTDLRNLAEHAGNRLCTQAQFHWRQVFTQIVEAIRYYQTATTIVLDGSGLGRVEDNGRWQFETIADSPLFRPICYQLGRCPFQASFDRECSIRERVEIRAKHGATDSSQWHKPFMYNNPHYDPSHGAHGEAPYITSEGIQPEEWMLNSGAARA